MTSPAFTRIESDANARFKRWKKLALESRSVEKRGRDALRRGASCDVPFRAPRSQSDGYFGR